MLVLAVADGPPYTNPTPHEATTVNTSICDSAGHISNLYCSTLADWAKKLKSGDWVIPNAEHQTFLMDEIDAEVALRAATRFLCLPTDRKDEPNC